MWKALPFDPDYEVSDQGEIRSWKKKGPGTSRRDEPKLLSPYTNRYGYKAITLWLGPKHKTFTIHQLVMQAFVGPCPEGCSVDHIDRERKNNALSNLQYLDSSENSRQGSRTGEEHGSAKLTWDIVNQIRSAPEISGSEWARRLDMSKSQISAIRNYKAWSIE